MRKNIKSIGLAFILAAVLPMSLQAKDKPSQGDRREHAQKRMSHMKEELNLSDAQVQKIKDINAKYKDKSKMESGKKAFEELNASLRSNDSDDVVRSKYAALESSKKRMSEARLNKILEIRAVLTKEQRAKFSFMHEGKGWGKNKNYDRKEAE